LGPPAAFNASVAATTPTITTIILFILQFICVSFLSSESL
jgi:hypothetical protein